MAERLLTDGGALPGLPDLIPTGRELSDDEIQDVASKIRLVRLPMHDQMGVPEVWAAFIQAFASRQHLRTLPAEERVLPWLQVHAPPRGTALVRSKTTATGQVGQALSVFGTGFGRGRRLLVTAASESGARADCVTYAVRLEIQVSLYRKGTVESAEVKILREVGQETEVRPRDRCDRCSRLSSIDEDPLTIAEPALDLRRDTVAHTIAHSIDLVEDATVEASFTIPSVSSGLKFTAVAGRGAFLEVVVTLPPGSLYRPYSLIPDDRAPLQSQFWVSSDS